MEGLISGKSKMMGFVKEQKNSILKGGMRKNLQAEKYRKRLEKPIFAFPNSCSREHPQQKAYFQEKQKDCSYKRNTRNYLWEVRVYTCCVLLRRT
jgi:hypothetical protein